MQKNIIVQEDKIKIAKQIFLYFKIRCIVKFSLPATKIQEFTKKHFFPHCNSLKYDVKLRK